MAEPSRSIRAQETLTRRAFIRRSALLSGTAVLAPGVLAACASDVVSGTSTISPAGITTSPAGISASQLLLATRDGPVNMDPRQAQGYASQQVYLNMFESLVSDRNYVIEPMLASDWRQLDELTIEFTLRDDVLFHNGDPFSAEDVKFSLESLLDPASGYGLADFLKPITRIEIRNTHTIVLGTSEPFAPLLHNLGQFFSVISEKAITGSDPAREPIGTGSYKLAEWITGDRVDLVRFDEHRDADSVYFDSARFRVIPEAPVRLSALGSGSIHWTDSIPTNQIESIAATPDPKLVRAEFASVPQYLTPNASEGFPFANKKLRQALAWAVDRKTIADTVWFGQYEATTELYPEGNPNYTGAADAYYAGAPDMDKAARLVEEAGYPNGITVTLSTYGPYRSLAEVLQQQVAPSGIDIQIEMLELGQFLDKLFAIEYELVADLWFAYMDPDNMYYTFFKSDSTRNFAGYGNDHMDELLESARRELDPEERKNRYTDVVEFMADEAPIVFLANERVSYAMNPQLEGSQPWADRSLWLDRFHS